MKRRIVEWGIVIAVLLGCLAGLVLVLGMDYSIPASLQASLELVRETANEDPNATIGSATITQATAGDWDHMPTEANGLWILPADDSGQTTVTRVSLLACAGSAADKTFTVKVWGWYRGRGPILPICSLAYTTGTQQVVKYPHDNSTATNIFWADTVVITDYWITTVEKSGNDGNNNAVIVAFNPERLYAIYFEVSSADGSTGTEAGDVTIYGYN